MEKRTKKYLINLILFLLTVYVGYSQSMAEKPVEWTTQLEKINQVDYNIVFIATIKKTWHLYSQNVPENGPLPTVFILNPNEGFNTVGLPTEEKGKTVYEDVFEMKIKYFETKAVFKQAIKIIPEKDFELSGSIDFMSCNSETCMPGSASFVLEIE